jgi:hypothetical protein
MLQVDPNRRPHDPVRSFRASYKKWQREHPQLAGTWSKTELLLIEEVQNSKQLQSRAKKMTLSQERALMATEFQRLAAERNIPARTHTAVISAFSDPKRQQKRLERLEKKLVRTRKDVKNERRWSAAELEAIIVALPETTFRGIEIALHQLRWLRVVGARTYVFAFPHFFIVKSPLLSVSFFQSPPFNNLWYNCLKLQPFHSAPLGQWLVSGSRDTQRLVSERAQQA